MVQENSWWAIYRHSCPHCGEVQVPRIDINAEQNAMELDVNVMALYGEGGDGDEEDSDEVRPDN